MTIRRNILVFGSFIAVIFSMGIFLYLHTSLTFPVTGDPFSVCEVMEDKSKRYTCYKDAALYAMQHNNKEEELAKYAQDSFSHLKLHAIGRAILITSDYNLEIVQEKCTLINCIPPYLHAFSEEWGEYAPSREKEFIDFLKNICPLDENSGCYHNIGHFYLTSNKSFKESMARCDELQSENRFYDCVYGVVHEQIIQADGEDLFSLCKNETSRRKIACFTIGSRTYPKWLDYKLTGKNPLNLCDKINNKIPPELNYCYASAAWVLQSKERTLDIAWCNHLSPQFKDLCIEGIQSPQPFFDVLGCNLNDTFQCETK